MTPRAVVLVSVWLAAPPALAQEFTYEPAGALVAGSGTGRADERVYVPDMRFPIEEAPAFANSQVWGVGGSAGPSGSQCDERNFSYPWHDNYCESRDWTMPLCPSGTGHQGQDIRAATCDPNVHWAVAAEDGVITSIGTYTVYLRSDGGTVHRYLHMARTSLAVTEGARVRRGDRLGRVSNEFGGTPTTVHLHYDLNQSVAGLGAVYVPTYMSLVRAYEALLGVEATPCAVIPPEGATVDDGGPCFTAYGPPAYWRTGTEGGVGGSFRWTNAWDGDRPGNWGRWRLHFAAAGRYRVEVDVVPPYARSTRVRYRVRHAGVDDERVVDQSAASEWVELGVFDFAAGGDQAVEVYDNTGETDPDLHLTADAVRIVPLSASPDAGPPASDAGPPDGGPTGRIPDEGSGCGCRVVAVRARPSAFAATTALVALAASRRRGRGRRITSGCGAPAA